MSQIVRIAHKKEPSELKISLEGTVIDTTQIDKMQPQEWAFPFCIKGVRWNGLYEELKAKTHEEDYTVYYDGDEETFEIIKLAFKDTKVRLVSTNNKVVMIYSENPFNIKITVNGSPFDTTRIDNRSIDEWVRPIQIRELNWQGIFKELEEHIGIDVFSIQFVGKPELMKALIDECPKNVDITYKVPMTANKSKARPAGQGGTGATANVASKVNLQNISAASGQMIGKMKQEISDEELNKNLDNIPIKNEFIRKNIMAICAALSLIFALFNFISFSAGAEGISMDVNINGFQALYGEYSTLISLILFAGPIVIIIMNYIPQLKAYRRMIAVGVPALCILGEIATAITISSALKTGAGMGEAMAEGMGVKTESGVSLGIGFWLILISYILTAAVGFISYYGLELPIKKKQ